MIDYTRQPEPPIASAQHLLTEALDACNALAKDYAALIVKAEDVNQELAKMRGAFDMAAESRGLWKRRALAAGWLPSTVCLCAADPDSCEVHRHAAETEPWTPQGAIDGPPPTIADAVAQALGTASLAWTPAPTGTFDDAVCLRIYNGLMAYLSEWADEQRKQARETITQVIYQPTIEDQERA